MDLDRVRNFSNQRVELKTRMETAEPVTAPETLSPVELFANLVARIESLPGFDPTGSFGNGSFGTWDYIFEPDETHSLPLELSFEVSYTRGGDADGLHATWHDNLNHQDDISAVPLAHEWVSTHIDPNLVSAESARMLGLIDESVAVAEELVARSITPEQEQ